VVSVVPPASPEPAKVAARPAAPSTTTISPAAAGWWTVVADLTRSRDEAEALQRQLRGHGYDAAVVRVIRDGDTWYRVRVGRFGTSAQADEMRQRLREREGVLHVFVASE
jgi:cell division protein FtsN